MLKLIPCLLVTSLAMISCSQQDESELNAGPTRNKRTGLYDEDTLVVKIKDAMRGGWLEDNAYFDTTFNFNKKKLVLDADKIEVKVALMSVLGPMERAAYSKTETITGLGQPTFDGKIITYKLNKIDKEIRIKGAELNRSLENKEYANHSEQFLLISIWSDRVEVASKKLYLPSDLGQLEKTGFLKNITVNKNKNTQQLSTAIIDLYLLGAKADARDLEDLERRVAAIEAQNGKGKTQDGTQAKPAAQAGQPESKEKTREQILAEETERERQNSGIR